MTTLNIYYQYKDRPRARVLSAIDPPDPLLLSIWKNVCLEREGQNYAITFRSADAVDDRLRYRYRYRDGGGLDHVQENDLAFGPAGFAPGKRVDQEPGSILLLLESPHFDEVSPCLEPLCPAAGETGERLHRYKDELGRFLQQACDNRLEDATPLILSNPVPHPASCRVNLGENGWTWWKELVFFNLLTRVPKVRAWFRFRLRRYQPVMILNACTKLAGTNQRTPHIDLQPEATYKFQTRGPRSPREGAPTAPKDLVADEIRNYLTRNGLKYRHSEYDKIEAGFTQTRVHQDCRAPDVYWVDLPHPSSW